MRLGGADLHQADVYRDRMLLEVAKPCQRLLRVRRLALECENALGKAPSLEQSFGEVDLHGVWIAAGLDSNNGSKRREWGFGYA